MKNKHNELECLVCKGLYFRKGNFSANYERYNERTKWSEKAEAQIEFYLESEEEDHPLKRIPEKIDLYSYICEDCGFIMSFREEKRVESRKQERVRKQKQKMYDWTKFK